MLRVVTAAGVVALLSCYAGHQAQAQSWADSRAFRAAFGSCGDPCVVRYNAGGEVGIYEDAARAVRAGVKRLVVIDGPCISACAIFADKARAHVCITPRARFGFHKATVVATLPGTGRARHVGHEDPPHSRDIRNWVMRNGGFPTRGLRHMNARQAAAFWRRCSTRGGRF